MILLAALASALSLTTPASSPAMLTALGECDEIIESTTPDPARVMRRTALALGIRSMIQSWPEDEAGQNASLQDRLAYLTGEPDSTRVLDESLKHVAQFVIDDPSRLDSTAVPSETCLRRTFTALAFRFPIQEAATASNALEEQVEAIQQAALLRLLDPAGETISIDALGGAGVSFQQALLEGATAFLVDRAKADLARSGLTLLQQEMEGSSLYDVFKHSLQLAGYEGTSDPRLYLRSLQAALASDLDALPTFLAERLQNTAFGVGVQPHHWELAGRSIRLVDDIQRGTHPLFALSTFSAQSLSGADTTLQRRLSELHVLATVLHAGTVEVAGQRLNARTVLSEFDGRRLFSTFLADELRNQGGAQPEDILRTEARVVALLQTLDDVVRQLESLRDQYAQIRAVNPEQSTAVYADYISVTTRAVRQILPGRGDNAIEDVLEVIEALLAIQEAAVQQDYPRAIALAMPYLNRAASAAGGDELRSIIELTRRAAICFDPERPPGESCRYAARSAEAGLQIALASSRALERGSDRRRASIEQIIAELSDESEYQRVRAHLSSLADTVQASRTRWKAAGDKSESARDAIRLFLDGESEFDSTTWAEMRQILDDTRKLLDEAWTGERSVSSSTAQLLSSLRDDIPLSAVRRSIQQWIKDGLEGYTAQDPSIGRLFSAAAAIAAAESSEGVYDALVLYVAPPGSFRDRRGPENSKTSISLGAYVGAIGGIEQLRDSTSSPGVHAGAFISVGLEISWGFRGLQLKCPCNLCAPLNWPRSFGIFLSPINLGTFADYGSGGPPEYTFAQVFSPSANLTLGLWETFPMTIGLGTSYVPEFRSATDSAEREAAWRISAFLAADIPLWIRQPD